MHELYELKEILMDELKEYGSKGEMSTGSLEVVDKLTHTIKNLCKIIEAYEDEEYSEQGGGGGGSYYRRGGGGSYRRGGSSYYRRGGEGGGGQSSYARGRGSNARRDSRGRYASNNYYNTTDEVTEKLEELMEEAPDEKSKMEIQKFMTKLEQM